MSFVHELCVFDFCVQYVRYSMSIVYCFVYLLCNTSAVSRILAKEDHQIMESSLSVIVLESLTDELCDQECGVLVTGITKSHSRDLIECYFENKRKSGGGDVEDFYFNEENNSAVITFQNSDGIASCVFMFDFK